MPVFGCHYECYVVGAGVSVVLTVNVGPGGDDSSLVVNSEPVDKQGIRNSMEPVYSGPPWDIEVWLL